MPSVTDLHQQSSPTIDSNVNVDPLTQAILLLEKKQRNLGKRKEKLESYEQEEKNGKDLHKDQKDALAKYGEVIGQIDCLKDVSEQLKKLQQETNKNQKRLLKQINEEKRQLVQQRLREYLQLRYLVDHRPTTLHEDQLCLLDELVPLIIPSDYSSISRSIETILSIYHQNVKTFNGRNCQEMKDQLEHLIQSFSSTSINEYSTPQSTQIHLEVFKQTPLILHAPPPTPASNLLPQQQIVHEESPFFPIVSTVDQQRLDHFNPLTDQWQQQRRTTGQHHSQYSQPGRTNVHIDSDGGYCQGQPSSSNVYPR